MVSAGQVGSIIISYCLKINGAQQGDELWLIQKKYGAKKKKKSKVICQKESLMPVQTESGRCQQTKN